MQVVDTSALYAFFVASDAHHGDARVALTAPRPFIVPAEILAETLALLEYRHGFPLAQQAAAYLQSMPNVEVQPTWDDPRDDILGLARSIHSASQGRLSHFDSIVVAWCRKRRLLPLAFDEHLLAAAAS